MREFIDRTDLVRNMPKNGIVAEVGVQWGNFSQVILKESSPKHLFLIDCWKHQQDSYNDPSNVSQARQDRIFGKVCERFASKPNVHIFREFSLDAAALFDESFPFDWVYLDANHSYEALKNQDMPAWWDLLRTGGFLCGHDYNESRFPGVRVAVDAFCRERGIPLYGVSCDQDDAMSWVIQK